MAPYESGNELEMEELVVEVPAVKNSSTHPINVFLAKHKNSKLTVLEILCKENGITIDKKFGYLIDNTDHHQNPSVLLKIYNLIMAGPEICKICLKPIQADSYFAHMQEGYLEGHHISTKKFIEHLSQEPFNWTYRANITPPFSYLGSPIGFK